MVRRARCAGACETLGNETRSQPHPVAAGDYQGIPKSMLAFIDKTPLSTFLVISLTLGLAPFVPEPHIWEKLKMLASGTLVRPIDIFDMAFHGIPWLLLLVKLGRQGLLRKDDNSEV
jgi:hypothetical protein